jgi:hypothetical protein
MLVHAEEEAAPTVEVYLPTEHPWHVEAPMVSEYVPGGQFRHVEFDIAPIVEEYVPAGHLRHGVS